ncbi:MAG: dihydroorotate dehydrogenase electron transfer subunit [Bacillota bacterium]|nr:dihydroorotate dehydrogenase electron transfer subunit [Bacillota bacterium]
MSHHIVLKNVRIAKDTYLMTLNGEAAASCAPGQFIHLLVPDMPHLILRRPFSVNDVDIENGTLDLVYKIVGEGTAALACVSPGEEIDALGPLGRGFALPENGGRVWLCGGGMGAAPLLFAAKRLGGKASAFIGFENKDSVYQIEEFKKACKSIYLSTDDGSADEKGNIIQLLERELQKDAPDMILACGPLPMLKALKALLEGRNIPCQVSLEERMGCGVGACLTCSCKSVKDGEWHYARVCRDGPVFDLMEVEL